jgi:hypothetical protein
VSGEGRYPYRVFVSYAHEDAPFVAARLVPALTKLGLHPWWDAAIKPGFHFSDIIRKQVATAHVFMPVLSHSSAGNLWVNQEIGFALGIDVPVLPVALGGLPAAMVEGIQAFSVRDDRQDLCAELGALDLDTMILPRDPLSELHRLSISAEVADIPEERTRLLVKHAVDAAANGGATVRQRALFSSFSMPDASLDDPIWQELDVGGRQYSELHRRRLREEREILAENARRYGLRLVISPHVQRDPARSRANLTQLTNLHEFLASMSPERTVVAISRKPIEGKGTALEHISSLLRDHQADRDGPR